MQKWLVQSALIEQKFALSCDMRKLCGIWKEGSDKLSDVGRVEKIAVNGVREKIDMEK